MRQPNGYAIGGVPPVGHVDWLVCVVDEDLLQFEQFWAAAGTARAVFRLTPADLQRIEPMAGSLPWRRAVNLVVRQWQSHLDDWFVHV